MKAILMILSSTSEENLGDETLSSLAGTFFSPGPIMANSVAIVEVEDDSNYFTMLYERLRTK